jgi:hypothetical protein
VIGIGGIEETVGERIKGYLESHGSWWHWINNFWLFVTDEEEISVDSLCDYLSGLGRDVRTIVFEFDEEIAWAGSGPRKRGNNMFEWVHETWNADSTSD